MSSTWTTSGDLDRVFTDDDQAEEQFGFDAVLPGDAPASAAFKLAE